MFKLKPALAAFGLIAVLSGPVAAQNMFAPVATINDSVVTEFEVQQRVRFLQILNARGATRKAAIESLIDERLRGEAIPVYGKGENIRDWLYVKDHCSAIRRVLEGGRLGETYNVGGWNEKPNIEIVKTVCALLDELRPRADGASYATQISYVKDRPGHDRRYAIDARKLEKELGWKPSETFETGIRKTVAWYLENTEWVANVQSGAYRDWVSKQYTA